MGKAERARLRHVAAFGQIVSGDEGFRGPLPGDFTFNSPIGLCMDRNGNVWICDTGNNRVVIVDQAFENIVAILRAPGEGVEPFLMPFHVCEHPQRDRMYVTDIGNSRVVAIDYSRDRFEFAFAFGCAGDGINGVEFEPLQDPNGITIVREPDGSCALYVCDEFFHAKGTREKSARPKHRLSRFGRPQPNRCVKFDEHGRYLGDFRAVVTRTGKQRMASHPLYWPQGISADSDGCLYLANTGSYEILKTPGLEPDAAGPASPSPDAEAVGEVFAHGFGKPNGIGMLNIMRSVNVIGERVFVADHVLNTISVYRTDGTPVTTIAGLDPLWNHGHEPRHALSDLVYYGMEDEALLSPYVICQGEAEDVFLVSEPFTSRILKIRIPDFAGPLTEALLVDAIGSRRNVPVDERRAGTQFNCVTSAVTIRRPAVTDGAAASSPGGPRPGDDEDLPAWLRLNPGQQWYMGVSQGVTAQYRFWYERTLGPAVGAAQEKAVEHGLVFNVDAGNWVIKAWSERHGRFHDAPRLLDGYYLPGDLAMALYYPQQALLGQLCPGTPLMFVTNFNLGTVSMYQFSPGGKLVNYGLPFGLKGTGAACLSGPQGLAVSDEGRIYIADSLNDRISMWRILQTGQVVFMRTFGWAPEGRSEPAGHEGGFLPTDVAIDADGRLFVTDQASHRICVFDRDGKSLWSFGREGYWDDEDSDEEHLMLPTSVSVDGAHLVVNDLVNRALKIFRIHPERLEFVTGRQFFKNPPATGGIWMPYLLHAQDRRIYVPDSTYNVVQIFEY